ncbi:hypothetical protein BO78DRAFT_449873 [Aspergillus sclerotiicarbonarius CBS 121057]|uniref:TLDc domain-containing protein n=1 Tax=Aspergillus sclerotiicarbonarius (strain CBS 121057 / IBT 28362) TaxID=1448318 RepID=A0A319E4Y4_ASPSB|nr:hypothetical protein BO78DRAFT_449873 [Aspergillus sclerotiicarbonarius CBS 121057]
MASILSRVADRILFGDALKKISIYFRTATPDSVLQDLNSSPLVQTQPTGYRTQAIFDASCLCDSPQLQPYWTKECLRNHIARIHPDTTLPDAAIDVLWSCFYFYAYHPFPRENANGGKLELPAFQRALTLLALRGTTLLGTVNEDGQPGPYWRSLRCPSTGLSNIDRIFRSISEVSHEPNPGTQIVDSSTFIIEDVMDVLATTYPSHIKFSPWYPELKEVAEGLLEDRVPQYQLKDNDLTALVSMILRLRLHKPTWGEDGEHFHYGSFAESNPQVEELANVMVQQFQPRQKGFLSADRILQGLDVVPNLEFYFHQLWAAIFQPHKPTDIPAIGTELASYSSMDGIVRAVSLFIPPYEAHDGSGLGREFEPVIFETSYDSSAQESLDKLSLNHITQHITHDPVQKSLLLVVGTQSHSMTPVVVGAFFPTTATSNNPQEEQRLDDQDEIKIPHPELLFQLQPKFALFRLNEQATLPPANTGATMYGDSPAQPYWIGSPYKSDVGFSIDPVTREGIFMQATTAAAGQNRGVYEELTGSHANEDHNDRSTKFTVAEMVTLSVRGGSKNKYP